MLLITHILIAVSSLGYSAYIFFYPSKSKLRVSYVLVGGTIATGTALLISKPSHILETCLMGLLFIAVSSLSIILTRQKLATVSTKQ